VLQTMDITLGNAAVLVAFLTNIGAHFYRAGKVDAQLKNIEATLNNGIAKAVQEHASALARIDATCKSRHENEVHHG